MTEKLSALLSGNTLMIGGHRGLSRQYPENTLHAVQAAIDLGVDLVETDVYLTKDDVPVLSHDFRLERCSSGTGLLSNYTLRELEALDFGAYRGKRFRDTRIATLEEYFVLMNKHSDVLIDVDIKPCGCGIKTAKQVVRVARSMKCLERCVFNSTDCDIVDVLYEAVGNRVIGAPDFYPGITHFKPGKDGTFSRMWGVCVPIKDLNENSAARLRDFGVKLVCTPADTPEQVRNALRCGVVLPLCDDPALFLQAVHGSQPRNI